jgi:pilus assembly protein CpaB
VGRLAQAQATGRLALSLVGNGDEAVTTAIEVDGNGLLGITEQEVVAVEQEQVCTITTRKSGEAVQTPIPCTN